MVEKPATVYRTGGSLLANCCVVFHLNVTLTPVGPLYTVRSTSAGPARLLWVLPAFHA